ncbi:MAG: hypothetical protein WD737_08275 [Gemmatimonadota bacterium]
MTRSYWLLIPGLMLAAAGGLHSQERDAHVLGPGEVRVAAEAEYWSFGEVYGEDGDVGIGAAFGRELTATTYAPLTAVAADLSRFLEETSENGDGTTLDPAVLTAGRLDLAASITTRVVPLRVSLGLLRRVEVGASLPVYRRERMIERFELEPGNVGINPEPAANAALLAGVSAAGEALGGAPVLPLAGSTSGEALQQRVEALTGERLTLPAAPPSGPALRDSVGGVPTSYHLSEWLPGDLEVNARVEVLRSFGPGAYPPLADDGLDYRLTALVAARFPTGRRPDLDWGFDPRIGVGFGGASLGVVGDLFVAERFWLSSGGSLERLGARAVPLFVAVTEGPLAAGSGEQVVRRSPDDAFDLWLSPRARLTPEFSVGGSIRIERSLAGTDEIGDQTVPIAEATRHSAGFTLRYSTLPAVTAGRGSVPAEIALGYSAAWGGSGGAPAGAVAYLRASLFQRLWGGPPEGGP